MSKSRKENALEFLDVIRSAIERSSESATFRLEASCDTAPFEVPVTSPEAGIDHVTRGPNTVFVFTIHDPAASVRAITAELKRIDALA